MIATYGVGVLDLVPEAERPGGQELLVALELAREEILAYRAWSVAIGISWATGELPPEAFRVLGHNPEDALALWQISQARGQIRQVEEACLRRWS